MELRLLKVQEQLAMRSISLTTADKMAMSGVPSQKAPTVAYNPSQLDGSHTALANSHFDLPAELLTGIHECFLDEHGVAGTVALHRDRDQTLDCWQEPQRFPGRQQDMKDTSWFAPLVIMSAMAALRAKKLDAKCGANKFIWIGKTCWPSRMLLAETQRELGGAVWQRNNIYVDATSAEDRVWAITQAAACSQVAAVIADGSGLADRHIRKIQLAAEGRKVNETKEWAMGGTIHHTNCKMILLARPPHEARAQSLAWARWLVRPVVSVTQIDFTSRLTVPAAPRWRVAWLGGKGPLQTCGASLPRWMELEWMHEVDDGASALRISAAVGSGHGAGTGQSAEYKIQRTKCGAACA